MRSSGLPHTVTQAAQAPTQAWNLKKLRLAVANFKLVPERALLWRRAWFCHTRTRARAGTVRSNCLFKKERTIEEHKKHAVWPLYLPERAVL